MSVVAGPHLHLVPHNSKCRWWSFLSCAESSLPIIKSWPRAWHGISLVLDVKTDYKFIVYQVLHVLTLCCPENARGNVLRYHLTMNEEDCEGDCKELVRERVVTLLGESVQVRVEDYHKDLWGADHDVKQFFLCRSITGTKIVRILFIAEVQMS